MKKIFVLMACIFATPVMADFYYGGRTSNCDLESMRAALDRATIAGHGAVITTVDCVPGPIVYELPESDCDLCY